MLDQLAKIGVIQYENETALIVGCIFAPLQQQSFVIDGSDYEDAELPSRRGESTSELIDFRVSNLLPVIFAFNENMGGGVIP
ncbi:Hypothetical protein I596_2994 [Dokdonella koreensis DS-123]|uniref:Uncharacterized protein n=1 Tax=Dokdonella koreensis DS-123 TaxID=1300342 RepID=A0A167H5A5_9GAMM|nr:Hypothetical protein I596_2994 [Dokdonella koreensis DS-123]